MSELYNNISMYSPCGKKMCHIGKRKASWYIKRGLAKRLSANNIQLLFEPKALGHHEDASYYLQPMPNNCVVCGTHKNLSRHHIVPHCYRMFFPEELKCHSWYDILPLCRPCHDEYELIALGKKKELADKYNAPLDLYSCDDLYELVSVIKKAHTMVNHWDHLPPDKFVEMFSYIEDFLGREPTDDDLRSYAKLAKNIKFENLGIPKHGEAVVSKFAASDFEPFIRDWRSHFLEVMKPRFLPNGWNVDGARQNDR